MGHEIEQDEAIQPVKTLMCVVGLKDTFCDEIGDSLNDRNIGCRRSSWLDEAGAKSRSVRAKVGEVRTLASRY